MRCSVDEAGRIVEDRNSGIVCMRSMRCSVETVRRIVEGREETRKAEKTRRGETERDENIREEKGVGEEVYIRRILEIRVSQWRWQPSGETLPCLSQTGEGFLLTVHSLLDSLSDSDHRILIIGF